MATTSGNFKAAARNSSGTAVLTSKLYSQVYWTATNDDANLRWKISIYVKLFSYSISWNKTTNAKITVGSTAKTGLTAAAASYSGSSFRSQNWVGSSSSPHVFYVPYSSEDITGTAAAPQIKIAFSKSVSATYSGTTITSFSGSANINLPIAYSKHTINSITIDSESLETGLNIIKPTENITLSWIAEAGSNQSLTEYEIYYTSATTATAPTTSNYSYMTTTSDNNITISLTNLTRGSYIVFGVIAKSEINSSYDSVMKTTDAIVINSLPDAPVAIASDLFVNSGSTVVFTLSSNDLDNGQSLSYYYSTSKSGNKTKITGTNFTTGAITVATTYYFWAWDGLEYSGTYTTKTVALNGILTANLNFKLETGIYEEKEIDNISFLLVNSGGTVTYGHSGGEAGMSTKYELILRHSETLSDITSNNGQIVTLSSISSTLTSLSTVLTINNLLIRKEYFRLELIVSQEGLESVVETSEIYCWAGSLATINSLKLSWENSSLSYPNNDSNNYINNKITNVVIDISNLYNNIKGASGHKYATLDTIKFYCKTSKETALIVTTKVSDSNEITISNNYLITNLTRGEKIYFYCIITDVLGQTTTLTNYNTNFNLIRVSLPVYNLGAVATTQNFNYYVNGAYFFSFGSAMFTQKEGQTLTYSLYISSLSSEGSGEGDTTFSDYLLGDNLIGTIEGNNIVLDLNYNKVKKKIENDFPASKNEDYKVTYKIIAKDVFGNWISSDYLTLSNNSFNFRVGPVFSQNVFKIRNTCNTSPNMDTGFEINNDSTDSQRIILPDEYCILYVPICEDENSTESYNDLSQIYIELRNNKTNIVLQTFNYFIDELSLEDDEYYICNFKVPAYTGENISVIFNIYAKDKSGLQTQLEVDINPELILSRYTNLKLSVVSEKINKDNSQIELGFKITDFGYSADTGDYNRGNEMYYNKIPIIYKLEVSNEEDFSPVLESENLIELETTSKNYDNYLNQNLNWLAEVVSDNQTINPYVNKTFMRLTVKFAVGYIGDNIRYIENSIVFISYADGATVAYRKHSLGINVENPGGDDILTIQQYGAGDSVKKYIHFIGTDNNNKNIEIFLDLSTGKLDGVIIDGGTW